MVINPTLAIILSDLFVNLAAGWLGASIILPIATEKPRKDRIIILTVHIIYVILSLIAAFELRKSVDI